MKYSISQVAEALDIPASTIRYYDKEGLLPFLERKESGYRQFTSRDIEMLSLIQCLKATNMSIEDIKKYADLTKKGNESLEERYKMFLKQRKIDQKEIEELEKAMEMIEHKCWYYETAIDAGTEEIHFPIKFSEKNEIRLNEVVNSSKE